MEPTLPGWQELQRQSKSFNDRQQNKIELLNHQIYRYKLLSENLKIIKSDRLIEKGEWIIYPLSDYEKIKTDGVNHKFSPNWSLPSKVIEVKNETAVVQLWGGGLRQVPLSIVHVLSIVQNRSI